VAKREDEEDGTISASRLQQLAAAFRTKGSLADDVATLKAANSKLSSENESLRTRLAAAEKENTQLKDDWAAIEKGILEPEAAGDAAAKAAAAIEKKAAAKTAQELRGMSHPPTKLPGKGAEPSADVKPPTRQQQAAADRHAYWAKRKAPWATAESN
jgi:regulator of replication initiation timing